MAALAATTPTVTGVVIAGAAVAASDTIARSIVGPKGAYLTIINGNAASDTVTVSDAGSTPAGNPLVDGKITKAVANGTSQVFHIKPEQFNPTTNLVTITHSVTGTVTYQLVPVG